MNRKCHNLTCEASDLAKKKIYGKKKLLTALEHFDHGAHNTLVHSCKARFLKETTNRNRKYFPVGCIGIHSKYYFNNNNTSPIILFYLFTVN